MYTGTGIRVRHRNRKWLGLWASRKTGTAIASQNVAIDYRRPKPEVAGPMTSPVDN